MTDLESGDGEAVPEEDQFTNLLDDDDWEDEDELEPAMKAIPQGWHPVKLYGFGWRDLGAVKEWCADTCEAGWKDFGYSSGCAYTIGVAFEHPRDAVVFKLRWS